MIKFTNKFKVIIFLAIAMTFISIACTDEAGQTEQEGEICSYYSDCKSDEICLREICVIADSYDCVEENDICPKDLLCSHVSGKCKPVSCNNHDECSDGQFCNGNVCKSACASDLECGDNYTCNVQSGECDINSDVNCVTTPEICTEDEICNVTTKECVSKEDDGCASDWECDVENGEVCKFNTDATNTCIMDPNRCTSVDDCLDNVNYICNNQHRCELTVRIDCTVATQEAECNTGEVCDPSDNKCVQCYENTHCTDAVCGSNRECIVTQTCTDDSTCPTGTKCVSEDGIFSGAGGFGLPGETEASCQEVDVCYVDTDCTADADGEERVCKVEDGETEGYCVKPAGNGIEDFLEQLGICIDGVLPCPDGQACIDLACYAEGSEPECSSDGDCVSLYPDRENQICQRGGCMEDPTPRCPNGDPDCQSDTMHMYCDSGDSICYSCVTDGHCEGSAVCRDHNCVNSSFCSSDGDCNGGRCVANVCE